MSRRLRDAEYLKIELCQLLSEVGHVIRTSTAIAECEKVPWDAITLCDSFIDADVLKGNYLQGIQNSDNYRKP